MNDIAIKLIAKLRKKGIKSIICSNNFDGRIRVLNERFDFLKDFDFVVLSYKHGITKPKLLEKVLEKTHFKPEEIVVIDDGKEIIQEAGKRGFKTILCEDPHKTDFYLKKLGISL